MRWRLVLCRSTRTSVCLMLGRAQSRIERQPDRRIVSLRRRRLARNRGRASQAESFITSATSCRVLAQNAAKASQLEDDRLSRLRRGGRRARDRVSRQRNLRISWWRFGIFISQIARRAFAREIFPRRDRREIYLHSRKLAALAVREGWRAQRVGSHRGAGEIDLTGGQRHLRVLGERVDDHLADDGSREAHGELPLSTRLGQIAALRIEIRNLRDRRRRARRPSSHFTCRIHVYGELGLGHATREIAFETGARIFEAVSRRARASRMDKMKNAAISSEIAAHSKRVSSGHGAAGRRRTEIE
jgi:hypothetical protein